MFQFSLSANCLFPLFGFIGITRDAAQVDVSLVMDKKKINENNLLTFPVCFCYAFFFFFRNKNYSKKFLMKAFNRR